MLIVDMCKDVHSAIGMRDQVPSRVYRPKKNLALLKGLSQVWLKWHCRVISSAVAVVR